MTKDKPILRIHSRVKVHYKYTLTCYHASSNVVTKELTIRQIMDLGSLLEVQLVLTFRH
jgi:hypothetical protein